MMKRIISSAVMVACMLGAAAAHAQDSQRGAIQDEIRGGGFFRSADDLPLMAGLQEREDDSVLFDQPDGRVVDVLAWAPPSLTAARIAGFYRETLPQLGWRMTDENHYVREGEKLALEIVAQDGGHTVRLVIQPRRDSAGAKGQAGGPDGE